MKKTESVGYCLERVSKVEAEVRTLTKTVADYHTRISRLERRARG